VRGDQVIRIEPPAIEKIFAVIHKLKLAAGGQGVEIEVRGAKRLAYLVQTRGWRRKVAFIVALEAVSEKRCSRLADLIGQVVELADMQPGPDPFPLAPDL